MCASGIAIVAGSNKTLRVLDISTGVAVRKYGVHAKPIHAIRLREVRTGRPSRTTFRAPSRLALLLQTSEFASIGRDSHELFLTAVSSARVRAYYPPSCFVMNG